jgi:hypothetical protein
MSRMRLMHRSGCAIGGQLTKFLVVLIPLMDDPVPPFLSNTATTTTIDLPTMTFITETTLLRISVLFLVIGSVSSMPM